ncbi:DUF6201 family protein [Xenorhabdus doucetiae]|uniref:Uncharacterized protein n=1 Tax=Xenorhabdus doucetiae TaxID=351671 RepID=A0A068QVY4_9GAMM|nr:DUF6201 family protein [Xenorhabdus doucetiae]TYO95866.1 hypothetical protein LY16_03489 [Xenorhabdus doucetiae]CDG18781.1 conserved protein of unknown function [Xenorhabdus doucetiae]
MKVTKIIKYGIMFIFFLWWFVLSHVTFLPSFLESGERKKDDYRVVFYTPLPVNAIGIYYYINYPRPYFAVLYKNNKYIGQSSPFYMDDDSAMMGDNYGFPNEKYDEFYIVCCNEYNISITKKEWWSKILQYFH